jgi:hypothetical protein
MPKAGRSLSKQRHPSKSQRTNFAHLTKPPSDLSSLLRGLYGRVARKLGVDPSYVSRVARSERRSEAIDAELKRQLNKVLKFLQKRRNVSGSRTKKQKSSRE